MEATRILENYGNFIDGLLRSFDFREGTEPRIRRSADPNFPAPLEISKGARKMNAPTSKDFDELEEAIAERDVPPYKLASALADLLLGLIADGRFTSVHSDDLDRLADYIRTAAQLLNFGNEAARTQIRDELWELADANRVNNSALYNLARCAIIVCGRFDEWNDAQDSPIFYCLQFLRKALPEVEPEFVHHFKRALI